GHGQRQPPAPPERPHADLGVERTPPLRLLRARTLRDHGKPAAQASPGRTGDRSGGVVGPLAPTRRGSPGSGTCFRGARSSFGYEEATSANDSEAKSDS